MPVYEFKCIKCMKITQELLPISSKRQKVKCDFCGGDAKRTLSLSGGYKMKGYSEKNGYSKEKK